jgi:hypothetical protein
MGIAAVALLLVPGAMAQDPAEGWINLFDGETLFGWSQIGDANWSVQDGVIVASQGGGGWLVTNSQFKDFELTLQIRVSQETAAGIVVRGALEGHPADNGGTVVAMRTSKSKEPEWKEVAITVKGDDISASVGGKATKGLEVQNEIGHIGIQYHKYHNRETKIEVKDIALRPLNLKPIFNGKNLDGWNNPTPERPSVFTVQDGWLDIENGNGQIETDDLYKDFLLQITVWSKGGPEMANGNPTPLNSGVFFRGPKGVFWKGYESQVRNEWEGDDRTTPVDYGTGGIYGVQEARKVMGTERENVYKTILATGNHFAVWVNGYQVSDMIDTRPVMKNGDGKNGYVPEAGTIHLQGHDPTTKIKFKDINIQVYP